MAKEYFKEHNLQYEEYDVSKDQSRLNEMVSKSHQMGVPVIDVNGTVMVGFDRDYLEQAVKESQK
jgi:glutaredoxin